MFAIHSITPPAFTVKCITDYRAQFQQIAETDKIQAITNLRIEFMCYLVAETLAMKSKTEDESVKQSCERWVDWASPKIGGVIPGINFKVLLEQWVKLTAFLKKCPVCHQVVDEVYPIAMSFLTNWADDSQPIITKP